MRLPVGSASGTGHLLMELLIDKLSKPRANGDSLSNMSSL
jgi:hypothetical protein